MASSCLSNILWRLSLAKVGPLELRMRVSFYLTRAFLIIRTKKGRGPFFAPKKAACQPVSSEAHRCGDTPDRDYLAALVGEEAICALEGDRKGLCPFEQVLLGVRVESVP